MQKIYTPTFIKAQRVENTIHHMINVWHYLQKIGHEIRWGIYHTVRILPRWIRRLVEKRRCIQRNVNYDPNFADIYGFMMDINALVCDTFLACDKERLYIDRYCPSISQLMAIQGFEFFQLIYLDQEHFDFVLKEIKENYRS